MSRARPAAGREPRRRGDVGFAVVSCVVLGAYNNLAGLLPWHHRRYTLLNLCATGAALAAAAASGLTATDVGLGRQRCPVTEIRKLTPDEVAALPSGARP